LGQGASELTENEQNVSVKAKECGGITNIELNEMSITALLNSTVRIEVVSSQGEGTNLETAPPESLEVLGTVEFSLSTIVLSPQPELFATLPLLDSSQKEIPGALVDFSLFLEETLLVTYIRCIYICSFCMIIYFYHLYKLTNIYITYTYTNTLLIWTGLCNWWVMFTSG
jgi:hypothetical protein